MPILVFAQVFRQQTLFCSGFSYVRYFEQFVIEDVLTIEDAFIVVDNDLLGTVITVKPLLRIVRAFSISHFRFQYPTLLFFAFH